MATDMRQPFVLYNLHCKKRLAIFLSPAGMPLTKLTLAGNIKLFSARQCLVSDIPPGGRENRLPFFTVYLMFSFSYEFKGAQV
jgi:hypothetical protein